MPKVAVHEAVSSLKDIKTGKALVEDGILVDVFKDTVKKFIA